MNKTIPTYQTRLNDLQNVHRPLPKSLIKAAGLLKGRKKVNPLAYQKQIRKEWERHFSKLSR